MRPGSERPPVILSASRRCDLPAFEAERFAAAWAEGVIEVANPFRPSQKRSVSLRPAEVDGYVFWTKNIAPFVPMLDRLREAGQAFVLQHSLNDYGPPLEPNVPPAVQTLAVLRELVPRLGPRVLVWRYDTVVLTEQETLARHRERFARLAGALAGLCDEVVTSFYQDYRKSHRRLAAAEAQGLLRWCEPSSRERTELLGALAEIARAHGMRLKLCSQTPELPDAVGPAACIDPRRLADCARALGQEAVAARLLGAALRPTRPLCGCAAAVDIGRYQRCQHGCLYCYASR